MKRETILFVNPYYIDKVGDKYFLYRYDRGITTDHTLEGCVKKLNEKLRGRK